MNFLHVGFAKAASTLLQRNYFTYENNFHNLLHHGPDNWRRFISHNLISSQSSFFPFPAPELPQVERPDMSFGLSCEDIVNAPVGYSVALSRWRKLFPSSRVLIVTRAQHDLTFSLFVQYVRAGYFRSIGEFTEELIWDAQQGPWGTFYFDRIYELTKEHFEYVKVIPYEFLRSEPAEFFKELNDFFEIDAEIRVDVARPSPSDLQLKTMRTLNRFLTHGLGLRVLEPQPGYVIGPGRDVVNKLKMPSVIERSVRRRQKIRIWSHRIASALECLPSSKEKSMRSEYAEEYKDLFAETFSQSNRNLSQILGVDLARFGYPMSK